jgi:hypothetical protein
MEEWELVKAPGDRSQRTQKQIVTIAGIKLESLILAQNERWRQA